jgi:hypothetical protein
MEVERPTPLAAAPAAGVGGGATRPCLSGGRMWTARGQILHAVTAVSTLRLESMSIRRPAPLLWRRKMGITL